MEQAALFIQYARAYLRTKVTANVKEWTDEEVLASFSAIPAPSISFDAWMANMGLTAPVAQPAMPPVPSGPFKESDVPPEFALQELVRAGIAKIETK